MKSNEYIAGCYRNLPIHSGESLPGYLLRLAEGNGYPTIGELLRVADIGRSANLREVILNVRGHGASLERLAAMAVGEPRHLDAYRLERLGLDAVFMEECRVSCDALLCDRVSYCPECLSENGFAREVWELAPVTVCTVHKLRMTDECHACGHPVTWRRSQLLACDACGSDYRAAPRDAVCPSVFEVAADFGALAPFRVLLREDVEMNVHWDEMFHVFAALLLPSAAWARREWKSPVICEHPVRIRHEATIALAAIRNPRCYHLADLVLPAFEALRPLMAIPRQDLIHELVYEVLMQPGGLSDEVAVALSGYSFEQDLHRKGASLFSDKPPSLNSHRDVANFLGVDLDTVSVLRELRAIPSRHAQHVGFDIDRLLAAQRFLREGLLTLQELTEIVGVEVQANDLIDVGLLPRWNPRNKFDSRVRLDVVVDLHLQLTGAWHQIRGTSVGARLCELSNDDPDPYRTIACAVGLILSRQITVVGWSAPFSWAAIEVDMAGADLVLGRMGVGPR
jgi:hypothetical protein